MNPIWDTIGREHPYWGVLTSPDYLQMTQEKRCAFFQTGEEHVEWVLESIERYFGKRLSFEKALDFGSGVGRLVIPFAQRYRCVIGIDDR